MTTRSKTRTAVWAVSSRSAGISGIVPKSAGNVTPSRVSRIPRIDAGWLRRCGIGQLDVGGDDPRGLQLLERDEQRRVDLEHDLAVTTVAACAWSRSRFITRAWANASVFVRACCMRGSASSVSRRRVSPSCSASVTGPAIAVTRSGNTFVRRVWTSSAVTTCALMRAASGSMTSGWSSALLASAVNRSVLNATWCAHTAIVATRIVMHARTRLIPARTLRLRVTRLPPASIWPSPLRSR